MASPALQGQLYWVNPSPNLLCLHPHMYDYIYSLFCPVQSPLCLYSRTAESCVLFDCSADSCLVRLAGCSDSNTSKPAVQAGQDCICSHGILAEPVLCLWGSDTQPCLPDYILLLVVSVRNLGAAQPLQGPAPLDAQGFHSCKTAVLDFAYERPLQEDHAVLHRSCPCFTNPLPSSSLLRDI